MQGREYSEWVPTGRLVKSLFAMIVGIVVFVTFAIILFNGGFLVENILALSTAWAVLGVLLLILWNYRGLHIQINDDKLFVEYGRFDKKSFALKDIVSCKKTKAFGRYLGIGVRYGLDGSIAYTTSYSSAVEIKPKVGRVFVFSSSNPDKICEIINRNNTV